MHNKEILSIKCKASPVDLFKSLFRSLHFRIYGGGVGGGGEGAG